MALHFKSEFLLILLGGIFSVCRAMICDTNRDSSALINGVNSNVADTFLQRLRKTNKFDLIGDNKLHKGGCRSKVQRFVHRKEQFGNDTAWILDCWEPVECVLDGGQVHGRNTISIVPKKWSQWLKNLFKKRVNAVLLPIDERNSISYTFLPHVHQRSALFVTSLLSGCSIFVATASNINCNIIVMHANHFLGRNKADDDDDNHKQAMFVLRNVQSANQQCMYKIQRRWAAGHKRENIDRHRHHYNNDIVYYDTSKAVHFFYGHIGGHNRNWQFCIKELRPDPRPEICSLIK